MEIRDVGLSLRVLEREDLPIIKNFSTKRKRLYAIFRVHIAFIIRSKLTFVTRLHDETSCFVFIAVDEENKPKATVNVDNVSYNLWSC